MTTTFKTAALAAIVRKVGLDFSKKGHYGTGVSVSNFMSGGQWDRGYATVSCSYGSSHWHDTDGAKAKAMADRLRPALLSWAEANGFQVEAGVAHYATPGVKTMIGEAANFTITPKS